MLIQSEIETNPIKDGATAIAEVQRLVAALNPDDEYLDEILVSIRSGTLVCLIGTYHGSVVELGFGESWSGDICQRLEATRALGGCLERPRSKS